jgi:SAM-dependent methyltransferase
MHQSSLDKMQQFVERHLAAREAEPLRVLDVGSMDVNGSYKPFFAAAQWRYQGVDLAAGNNVDVVLSNPYAWRELPGQSQDVVISGQAFEHIEFFWQTFLEIEHVLKPGGIACIIAPSRGYEHRYPVDCWRFYRDGMAALSRYAEMELLSAQTQWDERGYTVDDSDAWGDTVGVMRKPFRRSLRSRLRLAVTRRVGRILPSA